MPAGVKLQLSQDRDVLAVSPAEATRAEVVEDPEHRKRNGAAEGGPDRCIIGVDEVEGRFLAGQLAQGAPDDRVIRISAGQKLEGFGWSVFARKGFLSEWRKGRQVASIDLREVTGLPGAHNHQNACAAYAACRALGLAPRVIEAAFHSFAGLPHRSQTVAEKRGVRYVNEVAYHEFITGHLPKNEYFGDAVRDKLIYYPTVTREPFENQGRLTDLMRSGKLFADIGLPPLDPKTDRAMICGSPHMIRDCCALLDARGFKISPHIGALGDYVIERAFVEK